MLFTPETINTIAPVYRDNVPNTPDLRTALPHPEGAAPSPSGGSGDTVFDNFKATMDQGDPTAQFQPTTFNWDESGLDTFKANKNFEQFGYNPELGDRNQKKYWEAQTFGDVTKNVIEGFGSGLMHGFVDQLASWKNTASVFQDPTMQSAFTEESMKEIDDRQKAFDQDYHIFTNPDDNSPWISWDGLAKGIQGAGNIFGSVAELAAENIAVGLAIGATFGGAGELGVVEAARDASIGETTLNAQRLTSSLDKAANIKNSWNTLISSPSFKNAWNTTKAAAGYAGDWTASAGGITPLSNTLKFIGEDLMNPGRAGAMMSTIGKGFGAFYSDLRDLNLAVSMGQANASNIYQSLVQKESQDYKNKNGKGPEGLELQEIQDNALEASKKDGAFNSFVALYTNKLAFGNLLKGNKSIEDALAAQGSGIFSRIGVNSEKVAKDVGEKLFLKDDKWGSFRNSIVRGFGSKEAALNTLGKASLHGLGFGLTMSSMEVVDNAVKSFYDAKYSHKDITASDALNQSINKEFSAEGVNTFISGFLTGTIAGPTLDWLGGLQEKLNQSRIDKKETPKQKDTNQKAAEGFVSQFNDWWKDPLAGGMSEMIAQSKFKSFIKNGLGAKDQKDVDDTKDLASNIFLVSAARNKLLDVFTKHLQDHVSNLSPEELVQAFHPGEKFTPELHQEETHQINDFIAQSKDIGKIYNDVWRKFPNPYNPSKYKEGTDEYQREAKNYSDYKHAIDIATILKSTTLQTIERQNKILNGDALSKGLRGTLPDLSFTTAYNLSHPKRIEDELTTLRAERQVAQNPTEIDREINRLVDYQSTLNKHDEEYQELLKEKDPIKYKEGLTTLNKKYIIDEDGNLGSLGKQLNEIVQNEQRKNGKDPVSAENIKTAAGLYGDYYKLGVEHNGALQATNFILDPPNWSRYVESVQKSRKANEEEQAKKAQEETENKQKAAETSKRAKSGDAEDVEEVTDEQKTITGPKEDEPELVSKDKVSKDARRKEYAASIINETLPKLEEQKRNQEGLHKDLSEHTENDLKKTQKALEELIKPSNKGKGAKLRMKEFLTARTKLEQNLQSIQGVFDMIQHAKDSSQAIIDTFSKDIQHLSKALQEEDLSKIEEHLPDYIKAKLDSNPEEASKQAVEEARSQLKMYDKELETFSDSIQMHLGLIKKLDTYGDIYDALKDAKTKDQYKTALSKLYSQMQNSDVDKDKSKAITSMLNYINKLGAGEKVSEENLYAKGLGELTDALSKLFDKNEELLGNKEGLENKLKEAVNRANIIQDLDDKIEYVKHLADIFAEEESRGRTPTDFDEKDYKENEGAGEPPIRSDIINETSSERKKRLLLGQVETMGAQYYPAHIKGESVQRNYAAFTPHYKTIEEEKDGKLVKTKVISHFSLYSKSRFTDLEREHLTAELKELNNDPNSHASKVLANDAVLNQEGHSNALYKAASDSPRDLSRELTFGEIIFFGHPLAPHFLDKIAYHDHKGILICNDKGEYFDKDFKVTTDPGEMQFASIFGNETSLVNIDAMEKWLRENRNVSELTPKELTEQAKFLLNLRKEIDEACEITKKDPSKKARVKIDGRTRGIFNLEPLDKDGHKVNKSIIGVIVKNKYDPLEIVSASGERLRFVMESTNGRGSRFFLQGVNTDTKWSLDTNPMSADNTQNIVNAYKYKSTLKYSNDVHKDDISKCNYILNNLLYHSQPTKSEMDLVTDYLDGKSLTEEQESMLKALGADRFWEISGSAYRTFYTPKEGGGKKFDIVRINNTEQSIEDNKDLFFAGIFPQPNNYTLQGNEGKMINAEFHDYRISSGENGYKIENKKTYTNYAQYWIDNNLWTTNIIDYSKDGPSQKKQVDYTYHLLKPNVPLNKPIAKVEKKEPLIEKATAKYNNPAGLTPNIDLTRSELLQDFKFDEDRLNDVLDAVDALSPGKVIQLENGTLTKEAIKEIQKLIKALPVLYDIPFEEAMGVVLDMGRRDKKDRDRFRDNIKDVYFAALKRKATNPAEELATQFAHPEEAQPIQVQDVPVKDSTFTPTPVSDIEAKREDDAGLKALEQKPEERKEESTENKSALEKATGIPDDEYDIPETPPEDEETPC